MFRSVLFATIALSLLFLTFPGCQTSNGDPLHTSSIEPEDSVSHAENQVATAAVEDLTPVQLTVYGMSCPLCASNVDKQLLRVDGVKAVDVDMSNGLVTVMVSRSNPPSAQSLAKAVSESGFTLIGEPQLP